MFKKEIMMFRFWLNCIFYHHRRSKCNTEHNNNNLLLTDKYIIKKIKYLQYI